jgi:hypothetical protein
LKLFEIPVSLAGLYAAVRTIRLFVAKTAAQNIRICATVYMVLSSFLETTIWSSWKTEKKNRSFLGL